MRAAELGFEQREIGSIVAAGMTRECTCEAVHLPSSLIPLLLGQGYMVDSLLFAPVGFAMDKYGRKATGIPAFIFMSIGMVALGWATSGKTILLATVLIGIGNGLSSGFVMVLGSDVSPTGAEAAPFLGLWNLLMDAGSTSGESAGGWQCAVWLTAKPQLYFLRQARS